MKNKDWWDVVFSVMFTQTLMYELGYFIFDLQWGLFTGSLTWILIRCTK